MQLTTSGRLDSWLGSRQNNLDLLRLLAASLVIYGHSFHVAGRGMDPFLAWNGRYFIGGFALYIFFFASGLLVTNSFLRRPDIVHWVVSRALRIVPGLAVCLLLSVLVLGGLTSTLPPGQYFGSPETWSYIYSHLFFWRVEYYLPGVFATNLDHAVNGPLWSVHLEIRLYILAGLLLWIFRNQRREWLTAAVGIIATMGIVNPAWIHVFGENENNITCSALFAMGALCALWSDKLIVSNVWLAVLGLACMKFAQTDSFLPVSFFFVCYFVLCFAFFKPLTAVHLPGDYSYGLYIYGWPVQQLVARYFPAWSPELNAICSILLALVLAVASWYLIEKRALALKSAASNRVHTYMSALVNRFRFARPQSRPTWILAATGCVLVASLLVYSSANRGLRGPYQITNFGPQEITAGQRFNVQPDGLSAMWLELSAPASSASAVIFRGRKLQSSVNGRIVTALVPDELFAQAGNAEFYVLDNSLFLPRQTPAVTLQVVATP